MVDTNSDPRQVQYVIPANDDASKSIDKVMTYVSDSIIEGLSERKASKEAKEADKAPAKAEKTAAKVEKAPAKVEVPVVEAPVVEAPAVTEAAKQEEE